MSMLAEPRRYRNRYNLVPRGKALYEDEDRFGTKLLKKMGWEKGKGLGVKEQGNQDFIRVRYKNDERGLGFEDRDDHWTQHEENFTGLLKSLNGGDNEKSNSDSEANVLNEEVSTVGFGYKVETKTKTEKLKEKFSGQSLEEKSKRSKARVHYKKFTKGKDLSQYSEKDLANIFGRKAVEEQDANGIYQQFTAAKSTDEENVKEIISNQQPRDPEFNTEGVVGVQMINTGLSVGDYFKQKMEAMKKKLKSGSDEKVENNRGEITLLKDKNKGGKVKLAIDEKDGDEPAIKRKKKNNSDEETLLLDLEQEKDFVEPVSKKKKRITLSEAADAYELDYIGKVLDIIPEKMSKKKQKSNKEIVNTVSPNPTEDDMIEMALTKKKKKKSKNKTEEEIVLLKETDCNVNLTEDSTSKIRKKKCKDTKSEKTTENNKKNEPGSITDITSCKNKKKSKRKHSDGDVTKMVSDLLQISGEDSTNLNVLKKEKIKKRNETIDITDNVLDPNKQLDKKNSKKKNTTTSANVESNSNSSNTNQTKVSATIINTTNENVDDENSNAPTKELLSLDELIAKRDSHNVYTISSFCAEKFRNAALDRFNGSNMTEINGYGFSKDFKLNIEYRKQDDESIKKFWNCTLDKYRYSEPKSKYIQYLKDVRKARNAKVKAPRFNVKSLKRKRVFQSI